MDFTNRSITTNDRATHQLGVLYKCVDLEAVVDGGRGGCWMPMTNPVIAPLHPSSCSKGVIVVSGSTSIELPIDKFIRSYKMEGSEEKSEIN